MFLSHMDVLCVLLPNRPMHMAAYNPFVLCECYKTLYISLPSSAKQQREITEIHVV